MISVRAVDRPDEIETFHRRALEVYQPNVDIEAALPRRLADLATKPDLPPSGQRAAFVGDGVEAEIVGGYTIFERDLRIGSSRFRTGCIGAVYTSQAFRKQGVASALMLDAIDYAVDKDYALLLLDGIPGFYDKFGYVDMHDVTHFTIDTATLLSLETGAWQTRVATEDDADLLLDLYLRQFGDYAGSFDRSQEMQRFKLRTGAPSRSYVLALDPEGVPKGYIALRTDDRRWAAEVAAESWGAAQMLLKVHADFTREDEKPSDNVEWAVPPDSDLAMMLVDHLSVNQVKECIYTGGWMARVGNIDALLESLLPVWNQRLAANGVDWSGAVDLFVDDRRWPLVFDNNGVRFVVDDSAASQTVRLTQQQLVQLCFAYPSVDFAARDSLAELTPPAAQVFLSLFDGQPTWIAGTDFF